MGITTILVTHDQEEAFSMADRIGVMDRGRLQEVGRAARALPAARHALRRDVPRRRQSVARAVRLSRRPTRRVVLRGQPLVEVAAQRRRSGGRGAAGGRRARRAPRRAHACPIVGERRQCVELQFVGAIERLRLEVAASADARERAAPGRRRRSRSTPSRTARDVERACRSRSASRCSSVSSACTRCRRRSAACGSSAAAAYRAAARAHADRARARERMHIEPLFYDGARTARAAFAACRSSRWIATRDCRRRARLLERGARQVLAVG